jgi:hypothetical protein
MQDCPKFSPTNWKPVARQKIEWLQKNKMRKTEKLEALLWHLEDKMAWIESLIEKENEDM